MKNIKIAAAVLVVAVMASSVKAEVALGFDGASRPMAFEAFKEAMPALQTPIPSPETTLAASDKGKVLYELSGGRQALSGLMASDKYSAQNSGASAIIDDANVGVMYNSERVCFVKADQGGRHIILLENRDPSFVTLVQRLAASKMSQAKWNPDEPFGMCKDYITKEVCINKQVCRVVAAGAGAAVGGVPGAIAGAAVSQTICEWVPSCTDVQVCIAWY